MQHAKIVEHNERRRFFGWNAGSVVKGKHRGNGQKRDAFHREESEAVSYESRKAPSGGYPTEKSCIPVEKQV